MTQNLEHYLDKGNRIIINLRHFISPNSSQPNTQVQLCIVHQIRNSLKYVGSINHKQFAKELKAVYQAFTTEEAMFELDKLEEKWGKKYPIVFQSWSAYIGVFGQQCRSSTGHFCNEIF